MTEDHQIDSPAWKYLSLFALFCILYAIVEFVYFTRPGTLARYKKNFARVQNVSTKDVSFRMWPYGVLSYIVLFSVVWYFLVYDIVRLNCDAHPDARSFDLYAVISRATLLALAIYGIYNLTNASTLSGYDFDIIVMDTLWGVFAINLVAVTMFAVCKLHAKASSASGTFFSSSSATEGGGAGVKSWWLPWSSSGDADKNLSKI